MMRNVAFFYTSLCLIISFSSCEKEVPAPQQNSARLVVYSYISPYQSTIRVTVSLSRDHYGGIIDKNDAKENIRDATVVISDGNISKKIPWNAQNMSYELDATSFQISAGKTYYLDIRAPNKEPIFAETSIPEVITNSTFKLINVNNGYGGGGNDLYSYEFSVSNISSKGTYYRFYPKLEIDIGGSTTQTAPIYGKQCFKESGHSVNNMEVLYLMAKSFPYSNIVLRHTGYFISCSKEYYLFHKTLQSINNQKGVEIRNLYSNIKGGYGVFAGYNQATLTVPSMYGN